MSAESFNDEQTVETKVRIDILKQSQNGKNTKIISSPCASNCGEQREVNGNLALLPLCADYGQHNGFIKQLTQTFSA